MQHVGLKVKLVCEDEDRREAKMHRLFAEFNHILNQKLVFAWMAIEDEDNKMLLSKLNLNLTVLLLVQIAEYQGNGCILFMKEKF